MTRDDQNPSRLQDSTGLLADAADDDPRRGDFEEIHKAATTALELLAHLFPEHGDTPQ